MKLPDELPSISNPDCRERVRIAIIKLQARRKRKPTRREVQQESRVNMHTVGKLMRLMDAKLLDLGTQWGEIGAETNHKAGTKKAVATKARKRAAAQGGDGDEIPEWRRELAAQLAAAETDEARQEALRKLTELHALGKLSATDVETQRKALGEARQTAKEIRSLPTEQAERIVIATKAGALVLDAFERVCCDKRREAILTFVTAQLEEDLKTNPSYDPVGGL